MSHRIGPFFSQFSALVSLAKLPFRLAELSLHPTQLYGTMLAVPSVTVTMRAQIKGQRTQPGIRRVNYNVKSAIRSSRTNALFSGNCMECPIDNERTSHNELTDKISWQFFPCVNDAFHIYFNINYIKYQFEVK